MELSLNERCKAELLRGGYWLYAVVNCATTPELHVIHDPARLDWEPVTAAAHYQMDAQRLRGASEIG